MSAAILLIEDHPANRELMCYLLQAFGHRPIAACDGEEGLDIAASELPELILCDVHLPGIDGYEVVRRLRADPRLAAVPVVAITALAMVGDRDKVLAAGFDGYLSKPIQPETFVQQVEAFLPVNSRGARAIADAQATRSAPVAAATKWTILAVDNLPTQLDLIVSIFEPSGYRVVTATGATQALRLAQEAPPDLILSDVAMHEGDGYDLIAAVKVDPNLRTIPFVFLTSTFTSERDRSTGLALGAAKFLFRPIEPASLLEHVQACLSKQQAPG